MDSREFLAQNQFARTCHWREHQVLVAGVVRRGYSSLGEEDNSLCDATHFVNRFLGSPAMSMTPKAPAPALPDRLTAVRVAAAPVDEVLGLLDASAQGLSSAEVSARRGRYGPNAVRSHHANALAVLGRQLRSAVLILLGGTAVVSYFLGDSIQAIIIGVILAASIGLGFINEYRAERAAAALHSGVRHTAVARATEPSSPSMSPNSSPVM